MGLPIVPFNPEVNGLAHYLGAGLQKLKIVVQNFYFYFLQIKYTKYPSKLIPILLWKFLS